MGMGRVFSYCTGMIRVVGIITSALLLPWFFLIYHDERKPSISPKNNHEFKLGIENVTPSFVTSICTFAKKSARAGLITNNSGIDQQGTSSLQKLLECNVPIKKILSCDAHFRCPEVTLDNKTYTIPLVTLSPPQDIHRFLEYQLNDLDVVFFDMQDTGMRSYQTSAILFELIKIGALYDKTIVVLDRPNVLGSSIEGTMSLETDCTEVVNIPLRYGMTIGELARYCNQCLLHHAARLYVVPMEGYQRLISPTHANARQLASLQTHIDTAQSTNLLSILAEVRPFDMAQDTEHAYHCIMLPECMHFSKKNWHELTLVLKEHHLESSHYRYYNTQKKQHMVGLRLHVDKDALSSFNTLVALLNFFKEKGIKMTFSATFDKALGTASIRTYLEGNLGWEQLETDINKGLKNFYAKAQRAFIYKPYPKLIMM